MAWAESLTEWGPVAPAGLGWLPRAPGGAIAVGVPLGVTAGAGATLAFRRQTVKGLSLHEGWRGGLGWTLIW